MPAEEPVDLPRGTYPAMLDDHGRLTLPEAFRDYFKRTGVNSVFVTSLDRRTGRVYTLSAWREVQGFLRDWGAEESAMLAFNAVDFGEEVEIDSQGRIRIGRELQELLGIDTPQVWLAARGAGIELVSNALHEQRLAFIASSRQP